MYGHRGSYTHIFIRFFFSLASDDFILLNSRKFFVTIYVLVQHSDKIHPEIDRSVVYNEHAKSFCAFLFLLFIFFSPFFVLFWCCCFFLSRSSYYYNQLGNMFYSTVLCVLTYVMIKMRIETKVWWPMLTKKNVCAVWKRAFAHKR